jgi:hypothetical protein
MPPTALFSSAVSAMLTPRGCSLWFLPPIREPDPPQGIRWEWRRRDGSPGRRPSTQPPCVLQVVLQAEEASMLAGIIRSTGARTSARVLPSMFPLPNWHFPSTFSNPGIPSTQSPSLHTLSFVRFFLPCHSYSRSRSHRPWCPLYGFPSEASKKASSEINSLSRRRSSSENGSRFEFLSVSFPLFSGLCHFRPVFLSSPFFSYHCLRYGGINRVKSGFNRVTLFYPDEAGFSRLRWACNWVKTSVTG